MSQPPDDEFWQQSQESRRSRLPRYAWLGLGGLLIGGALVALILFIGRGSEDNAGERPGAANAQRVTIYKHGYEEKPQIDGDVLDTYSSV